MNGIRYYPNFGSVRTVNFTCDVYANDSLHGVCFPTVCMHALYVRMRKDLGDNCIQNFHFGSYIVGLTTVRNFVYGDASAEP